MLIYLALTSKSHFRCQSPTFKTSRTPKMRKLAAHGLGLIWYLHLCNDIVNNDILPLQEIIQNDSYPKSTSAFIAIHRRHEISVCP